MGEPSTSASHSAEVAEGPGGSCNASQRSDVRAEVGAVPVLAVGAAAIHVATTDGATPGEAAVSSATDKTKLSWHSICSSPAGPHGTTPDPITTPAAPPETTPTAPGTTAPATTSTDIPTTPTTPQEATPTSVHSILKKVTFSTPEVSEQHRFELVSEGCGPNDVGHVTPHSKARKVKKRRRHHKGDHGGNGEEEAANGKRRRMKEGNEASSKGSLGQRKGTGTVKPSSATNWCPCSVCVISTSWEVVKL